MQNKKTIIIILLAIALFLAVVEIILVKDAIFSPKAKTNSANNPKIVTNSGLEPVPYGNESNKFSIQVPRNWQYLEDGLPETVKVLFAEKTSGITPSITVSVSSAEGKDLKNIAKSVEDEITKAVQNYELISQKTISLNGKDAIIIYSKSALDGNDSYDMRLFVVNQGNAYVIDANCPAAEWDKNKNLLESSLMSFQFL